MENPPRVLLIVDDEEGPRQSLDLVFRDTYETLIASSGEEALRIADERGIDTAIVDVRMPGLSGIETLGKLKEIDPTTEVVILTAFETLDTARKALRLGAFDYLSKPFDIPAIRASIAHAMERRDVSNRIQESDRELGELRQSIYDHKMGEQMARTKGEIYASVIHDINGPMTVTSGFIDIINHNVSQVRRLDGASLDELKSHLSQITRQVDACINISHRYLGFFRTQRDQSAEVSVNQALADLVELLRVHPSAKNNKLKLQSLEMDCAVIINGTDLIQGLLNLSINALQSAARPHMVDIVARRLDKPLELSQFVDGPDERFVNRGGFDNTAPLIAISISDDGGGIPPEVVEKLFDTYVTTKSEGKGTGLGLAITHRFVKEANGAVHLKTDLGRGTTFTLYFAAKAAFHDGRL